MIFTRRDIDIEAYPAIKAYLEKFKERLMPKPKGYMGEWKGRKAGDYEWYEIQDPIVYYEEFYNPKIIIPAIVKEPSCLLDTQQSLSNDKTTIIAKNDLYLLGILNSKIAHYFMQSISATRRGGYYEYKPMYITQIPIRKLDLNHPAEKAQHDKLVGLVEKMLALKANYAELVNSRSDRRHEVRESMERTDKAIDAAVYALYGLSAEEIAIVENLSPDPLS